MGQDVHGFDVLGHLTKLLFIGGTLHLTTAVSEVHSALWAGEAEDGHVVALVVLNQFLDLWK